MPRNNVKILTLPQLNYLKEKYIFEYDNENIIVKIKNYNRTTCHSRNEPFSINSKARKVTFSKHMIDSWIELNETGTECSLLDVMQASNKLYIMFQKNDIPHIKQMLQRESIKIRKL